MMPFYIYENTRKGEKEHEAKPQASRTQRSRKGIYLPDRRSGFTLLLFSAQQ
jgi:hypothetical protein